MWKINKIKNGGFKRIIKFKISKIQDGGCKIIKIQDGGCERLIKLKMVALKDYKIQD